MGFGFSGFQIMFGFMAIMFAVTSLFVIGVFIIVFSKGIKEWKQNNASPRVTVEATVLAKRMNFTRHSSMHHTGHHTHTQHYVTFELESGDRAEFSVPTSEYGLIIEGDRGNITFQGTRFLSFERQ